MNHKRAAALLGIILAACLPSDAGEKPKPSSEGKWDSPVTGKALKTELFVPADDAPGKSRRGRPGIIYLKNLNAPRTGKEPDESIIADLLKEGYLVLTIDYAKDAKAVAPHINHDLRMMRHQLGGSRETPGLFHPQQVQVDWTYILPEGYRLLRDVLYYGSDADSYRMDIRYPSRPESRVPAVIQVPVDNGKRMGNDVQWRYNEMIAEGLLTRGYAAVQVDNPIKHYKGVDYMPDVAVKLKAAVRTVRANAAKCNIDADHIGVMGFSRGSGQAGLLAMSGGIKALEKGPHLEYSSRVQAALLHAGRMDHIFLLSDCPQVGRNYLDAFGDPVKNRKKWEEHSAVYYVTADDPPTFLSVGEKDWYRVKQISLMAEALKKAGVEHKHVVTPGMEHMATDNVEVLGQICDFFDKHLKPASGGATAAPAGARAVENGKAAMKSEPLERMKRFKMKQFVLGSWTFGNPYNDAYAQAYKSAGLNTMVDAPTALGPSHKAGLRVIITTILHPVYDKQGKLIPGKYTLGPYARLKDLKWFHENFGRHPALIGYLLNDNCQLHDYTIECATWLKENVPGMYPYMSHNPDPAGQAKVVDVMPILSTQNYPYGYHNDWPEPKKRREFCERLEADRAHANKHDMILWPIFAVLGKPSLGQSQIRFQAFSSIAYGAQGMFYFAYSGRRPVWKKDGAAYLATKYCNEYIAPLVGPAVLGYRSIGVYHTSLDEDGPAGSLAPGAGKLIERMDEGLLAGVLVAEADFKAGRELPAYVVVVDKRTADESQADPPQREVRLTFAPAVKAVEIVGAGEHRAGRVAGGSVTLKLKGGDGVLLRVETAQPKGK